MDDDWNESLMRGDNVDWGNRLMMADSQNRAPVLVAALDAARGKKAKADLLREWFNCCDALAHERHTLRIFFAQVGWVTDSDEVPEFPVTVYRAGWEDDDVDTALSWTTDKEVAERFARGLSSMRAQFLGIYREGVVPYIWQATCESAFAYFNSRDEKEVVPEILSDVEPIAMLVKQEA
jgi:hypothetical protein